MPNINSQWLVSQNLTNVVFEDPRAHYLYNNYLMPAIYAVFDDGSLEVYVFYSFFVSFSFLFLIVLWFINYHGEQVAIRECKIVLLLSFPFSFISFYWVGMDGMTLLLMAAIMMTWNKFYLSLMFGCLLGVQHFEQGVLAFALLGGSVLLFFLAYKKAEYFKFLVKCLVLMAAILLGKLILSLIFKLVGVELDGGRDSYMLEYFDLFFSMWKSEWIFILWSFLGVSWFFIFFDLSRYWAFVLVVIFTFFFVALVGDQTRVGVIVLFPSLFFWVLSDKKLWSELSLKSTILMTLMFLTVPIVVVWGSTHGSVSQQSVQNIKRLILEESYTISSFNILEPFVEERAVVSKSPRESLDDYSFDIEFSLDEVRVSEGSEEAVEVFLSNSSGSIWPGPTHEGYPVNFSYRIIDNNGKILIENGVRTSLPHDIAPRVSFPLLVNVSSHGLPPGEYLLKPDLVHESFTWFGGNKNVDSIPLIVLKNDANTHYGR